MSTEIAQWFAGLTPEQQQTWLDAWENGGITAELVDTLPAEKRPNKAGAWVYWVHGGWVSAPETFSTEWIMRDELRDFLDAEYGRRLDQ
jgi:hypothetical protein